jgi:glycine cleavage system H protein
VAVIRGWDFPEDLYYQVEKHVWVRRLGADAVQVGLTPVGYELLRHSLTAISVRTKQIGEVVPKGKSIAMVESLKYIGPLAAPITGVLVRANERLRDDPDSAPADPYGAGWIAELQPLDWEGESAALVTGEAAMAAYETWLSSEKIAWE